MQIAYRASHIIDAHLAKHALEDAGITAFVFGESLLGGAGGIARVRRAAGLRGRPAPEPGAGGACRDRIVWRGDAGGVRFTAVIGT
ncbi:hypothetical protein GGR61_002120 [Xanthomonas arboricola]|nr:hypothetical protein [Xanthomonas sp. 3058]